jgi:hypothetical protein
LVNHSDSTNPAGGTTIDLASMIPKISAAYRGDLYSFFAAAQHDFADRLKWAVTPGFSDANHTPKVRISGPICTAWTDNHVVLEATDDGTAHLTRYQRVIVTVK